MSEQERIAARIIRLERENARLQARLNHWNFQRDTVLVPVYKIKWRKES
jgi:hypothetical protein